ncbi:MAG: extracellular solute-binding protein [Kiritimatiellia bacterium]|nr:extracellular solute-binding protein [Kiritimatiellia bacterium]MDP6630871.1 extracellular solute-binding protein [Kiritimatiellia bacterium]MDP6811139.1 extracellular solute-binding protein [Kiritimatiellia bacterium]MDP7023412.1 extracellular solute-binding protein [Kiritimatiellia bacterium]
MRGIAGAVFVMIAALPYVFMLLPNSTRPPPATAAITESLSIISPHRREVRQEYTRGFSEWMAREQGRFVRIQWIDVGGTSKIMKDLESRYAATPHSAGIDLMFGGGVDPFLRGAAFGWLAPVDVPPDVLAGIPPACAGTPVYASSREWYGVALSGFGILCNNRLLDQLGLPIPREWKDLAEPVYASWLGSGDPRTSGSVHMCYEIVLQAYGFEEGWRLLTRVAANVRRFGEGGGAVPREVAAGEVAAGMVIDQYARTVIDAIGDDLSFVLPRGVTLIGADSIAMLKGAPSPELAALFISYCLSDEGQALLYQPAGRNGQRQALHRLPVQAHLYDSDPAAPEIRPYALDPGFIYDTDAAGRRWRIINDLVGVWLIDAHTELTAAWQTVRSDGLPQDSVAALTSPPVTASELDDIATRWDDARLRLATMTDWAHAAQKRYTELSR